MDEKEQLTPEKQKVASRPCNHSMRVKSAKLDKLAWTSVDCSGGCVTLDQNDGRVVREWGGVKLVCLFWNKYQLERFILLNL